MPQFQPVKWLVCWWYMTPQKHFFVVSCIYLTFHLPLQFEHRPLFRHPFPAEEPTPLPTPYPVCLWTRTLFCRFMHVSYITSSMLVWIQTPLLTPFPTPDPVCLWTMTRMLFCHFMHDSYISSSMWFEHRLLSPQSQWLHLNDCSLPAWLWHWGSSSRWWGRFYISV